MQRSAQHTYNIIGLHNIEELEARIVPEVFVLGGGNSEVGGDILVGKDGSSGALLYPPWASAQPGVLRPVGVGMPGEATEGLLTASA